MKTTDTSLTRGRSQVRILPRAIFARVAEWLKAPNVPLSPVPRPLTNLVAPAKSRLENV